jgi:hypothetical protein
MLLEQLGRIDLNLLIILQVLLEAAAIEGERRFEHKFA